MKYPTTLQSCLSQTLLDALSEALFLKPGLVALTPLPARDMK